MVDFWTTGWASNGIKIKKEHWSESLKIKATVILDITTICKLYYFKT